MRSLDLEGLYRKMPRWTIVVALTHLLTTLLCAWFYNFSAVYLSLRPDHLSEPSNWYRFVTYAMNGFDLFNTLFNALLLIFLGFLIEEKVGQRNMRILLLPGIILYGLIHTIVHYQKGDHPIVYGIASVMIMYFTGLLFICFFYWKEVGWVAKIVAGVLLVDYCSTVFTYNQFVSNMWVDLIFIGICLIYWNQRIRLSSG